MFKYCGILRQKGTVLFIHVMMQSKKNKKKENTIF